MPPDDDQPLLEAHWDHMHPEDVSLSFAARGEHAVAALLHPARARTLAQQLLRAAEIAEGMRMGKRRR